jgi:DUF4097 and DUF4098 domain-containing protein YvlB
MYKTLTTLLFVSIVLLVLPACSMGNRIAAHGQDVEVIFGNVKVSTGTVAGELGAINGNVNIASKAKVQSVSVVNGNIEIDDFSQASSLETVNGNITAGKKVIIDGTVATVNGNIRLGQQGEIAMNIETINGSIFVGQGVHIKGDIIFNSPGDSISFFNKDKPRLKIAKDVTIEGKIHLYRPVELDSSTFIDAGNIVHHYSSGRM